jgi:hypothetical protein
MSSRLSAVILAALLAVPSFAKDKDKNKSVLPEYVLRAQTVLVVIDPNAGEPLNHPNANYAARENVEKALTQWGRFRVVMDGEESDLIISVRTGSGQAIQPTIQGGPMDRRPGIAQGTDTSVRIGGRSGQPPLTDPNADPRLQGPHIGSEIGSSEDTFALYRGGLSSSLDAPPVWRYIKKDCLKSPEVKAVEEFRKLVVEAEKPKPPSKP